MKFGWINIFGTVILIIMLIPNIIYALKERKLEDKHENKVVNILEQVGRYLSMFFLVFPIGVSGFSSVTFMLIYLICNSIFLLVYVIIWCFYFKSPSLNKSLILSFLPTLIFLISGVALNHCLLIISSLIFGSTHIYITYKNNNKNN